MLSSNSQYPRESGGYDSDEDTSAVVAPGFNAVGLEMAQDKALLVFGVIPDVPRIALPFARVAITGDVGDLKGYLNAPGATVQNLVSGTLTANNATINIVNAAYAPIGAIDTGSITTNGAPIVCDWYANETNLPTIELVNNPLKTGYNSDNSKGGFQLGEVLIGLGEAIGTEALMYVGKNAGGWLLSLGSDALSLMSGYTSLSEAGLSIGADAAGTGAALGGDLAAFEAGSEGLVLASTASEAASLFSSAGVLAEGGVGFATAEGEAGEALLAGIESSTAEFEEVQAVPDLISTITGSAKWIAF